MSKEVEGGSTQRAVFCDFDGTITAVETFVGMLKEFAPKQSAIILPQMYARTLTLREGVRQLLESIPTTRYQAMLEYGDDKPLRPGLPELLQFLGTQGVPFHVVSGGLRGMVERVLSRTRVGEMPIIEGVASITALEVDAIPGQAFLTVPVQRFEAGSELVAKVKVMEEYGAGERVVIGDSLTDINMALQADLVFARDRLIDYLEQEQKPYIPWQDFLEVRDRLAERWGVS
ncbi:HAD-IB family phosphatase [Spirulina subsalsa FACHB-351]|uniref:phosphoserine phosphatase n=1 Tax=Spirulina subsalsa FACHB-351 TaxID=234711 RepID=A0ABT3L4S5_9CYAN|nr:HAD-IB family phosphatase [Spirulina subsalsa]MCW6036480.1 HAD-IB family phosphatase [Spirulina subsalsa FACHB-351]